MTHEALPWLGFPPTVDLANTVMVTLAGELDLLEDEGQLGAWIAAERGRIVGVEAASGRLPEVRALRETVRELLHARANGEPPPEKARRRVNAICASVPVRAVLTPEGRAVEEPDAPDTYALFESTVSRSAVELADRDEDRLSVPRGASRRFARTGPTFDLSTPRAKPIANLTASLAGFGLDPLREFVRSGAAARARGQGFGRRLDYRLPGDGGDPVPPRWTNKRPTSSSLSCIPSSAPRRKTAYATRSTRWSDPSRANVCGAAGR